MSFDTFAVVDWSAGNDTGPTPCKDAIWAAVVACGVPEEPVYLRNRTNAQAWLTDLIKREQAAKRRLLIGFDFPFGYPFGFAKVVTGAGDPLALWSWIADRLEDTPKTNSRFDLAGAVNSLFPGTGPFWFNGLKRDVADLPRKGTARHGHGMPERRVAETRASGTFTCWQMGGAGAVGGQVMTGIAALERLRRTFPETIAVWPFERLERPVAFVEIWPSLIDPVVREADDIRDRAQVRLLTKALAHLPPEQLEAMIQEGHSHREEGWILGLGHEAFLQELARTDDNT
ncbi:MAG: molybdopterin guanine dinucleotide synthesis [Pseudomonadota bacterium]